MTTEQVLPSEEEIQAMQTKAERVNFALRGDANGYDRLLIAAALEWERARASVAAPPREPTEAMLSAAHDVWLSMEIGQTHRARYTALWQAMLDASPAERVEGADTDIHDRRHAGTLNDANALKMKSDPAVLDALAEAAIDAKADEECDAAIFRSRFNVANAGAFSQRVDYDRALYRDAYRAGFAARVAEPVAAPQGDADGARLDWLDRDDIDIQCGATIAGEPYVHIDTMDNRQFRGKTIREAVDNAMAGRVYTAPEEPMSAADAAAYHGDCDGDSYY